MGREERGKYCTWIPLYKSKGVVVSLGVVRRIPNVMVWGIVIVLISERIGRDWKLDLREVVVVF